MAKRKRTKGQTTSYKALHRKQTKDSGTPTPLKTVVTSGDRRIILGINPVIYF